MRLFSSNLSQAIAAMSAIWVQRGHAAKAVSLLEQHVAWDTKTSDSDANLEALAVYAGA
jgi:hypothetical protein